MPLIPEQTTFRRIQTDDPASLTAFFSVDGTDALGRPQAGAWESITLPLTAEEAAFALALVGRLRQAYCDKVNDAVTAAEIARTAQIALADADNGAAVEQEQVSDTPSV